MPDKPMFGKFESVKRKNAFEPDQKYFDDLENNIISRVDKEKKRSISPLIYGSVAAVLILAFFFFLPDGFLKKNPDTTWAMYNKIIINNLDYYDIDESVIVSYLLKNQESITKSELMQEAFYKNLGIKSEEQIIEYLMEEDIDLENEL